MHTINGLIAAPYTPLKNNGSLHTDLVPKYSDFLKANNVKGAFINGSTGDFVSLTTNERKEILEAWSVHKTDDFKLIAHVGDTSLERSIDLTIHAKDKVDAIATLAPYYFKPATIPDLIHYLSEIAGVAPDLPFYYYHIPDLTGLHFDMLDLLEQLNNKIPNFAGIKFTKNNLIDYKLCLDYENNNYNILFGADEILVSSLVLGATGWVGSTYNHLAPLYTQIISAFQNNEIELAAQLQTKSMLFVKELASYGFSGAGKSFMKHLGVDCGPSRLPNKTLMDGDLLNITKKLDKIGLTPYFSKI